MSGKTHLATYADFIRRQAETGNHAVFVRQTVARRKENKMRDALICPYCKEEQYTHEDDEISAFMCFTECEHCGKEFWYSVSVTREYEAYTDEEK